MSVSGRPWTLAGACSSVKQHLSVALFCIVTISASKGSKTGHWQPVTHVERHKRKEQIQQGLKATPLSSTKSPINRTWGKCVDTAMGLAVPVSGFAIEVGGVFHLP